MSQPVVGVFARMPGESDDDFAGRIAAEIAKQAGTAGPAPVAASGSEHPYYFIDHP